MSAAEDLLGLTLDGHRHASKWTVTEKIPSIPGQSPGVFSVAYRCVDQNGRQAFMKASDISRMTMNANGSILERLNFATNAHAFERQVLDRCHGNKMDRVVTAIDYGEMQMPSDGNFDVLFFLVFELAQSDLRKRINKEFRADLIWIVTALHNFAVAINQLHKGDIYHNDLKPANALVFDDTIQKVADLGRATTPHFGAAHDKDQCAGDIRFAPPEQIYPAPGDEVALTRFQKSQAGDLYNLGSLGHFLLTSRNLTPEIVGILRPEYRPQIFAGGWADSFRSVLMHWRESFDLVILMARDAIPEDCSTEVTTDYNSLVQIIKELCEPDPVLRGDPISRGQGNPYSLERYISSLNLLRTKLVIRSKSEG